MISAPDNVYHPDWTLVSNSLTANNTECRLGQMTVFNQTRISATAEITYVQSCYIVQGHSRSPVKSPYVMSY